MIRLTRAQVREIDRLALERYSIPGIVLMENAGRAVADAARKLLPATGDAAAEVPVLIFCGGGNNGGDGLAAARHLHNRGVPVSIVLATDPNRFAADALINWRIVQAMRLTVAPFDDAAQLLARPHRLIIDAILGTGLTDAPRQPVSGLIDLINARATCVLLAVDLPSGMDCDAGTAPGACIRASHTLTLVAEKAGFAKADSRRFTGDVSLGDIGVPPELILSVAKP